MLFQTASVDIFKVLNRFIEIRKAIAEKWSDSLAIPRDLYQEWQVKASEFLGSLVLDIKGSFPACMKNNQIAFMNNMIQLSGFLHLAVYPQPVIPIAQLMPLAIEDGNLQFNSEKTKHLNCLELIFDDFSQQDPPANLLGSLTKKRQFETMKSIEKQFFAQRSQVPSKIHSLLIHLKLRWKFLENPSSGPPFLNFCVHLSFR